MGDEPASKHAGAVFLSYASEDASAAERIASALRSAGIEVWFDKSELRGGDAWDRRIRERIRDCRLFIPVVSASTEARAEGYFRREWRLAVERAGDMAEDRAFLVPVVIDGTSERSASVPEKFRELHWTRLPGGDAPRVFAERVQGLLADEPASNVRTQLAVASKSIKRPQALRWKRAFPGLAIGVAALGLLGYFAFEKFPILEPVRQVTPSAPASAPTAGFAPPPHSIAVLPFVNMSGDKEQEYFSDGLTEELLNSLAEINELQVAARTSAFSFKGTNTDIGTIARKLNVGAVLEGSVRRSANTIRITAQLINAVTGFHLWSKTYDRDLGDVLKLQTEIATAVASALKVTLLGDVAAKVELGGTRNPAAFDAYLRGAKAFSSMRERQRPPCRDCRVHGSDSPGSALCARVRRPIDRPFAPSPGRPRPQRRCVKALTRRRRMRARRLRSRRIWPRPTSHWRMFRKREPSTSRRRMTNTSGRSRSRRAMPRFCETAAYLQPYMGHFDAGVAAIAPRRRARPARSRKPFRARPGAVCGPPL